MSETAAIVDRCVRCGLRLNDLSGAPEVERHGEYIMSIRDDAGVYHNHCWGAPSIKSARRAALEEALAAVEAERDRAYENISYGHPAHITRVATIEAIEARIRALMEKT